MRYIEQLVPFLKQAEQRIILCPSFLALAQTYASLAPTRALLGAQTCSAFAKGSYTGQIDAQSLKQAGCSFCLVGHSERRTYCHETIEDTVQQAKQLLQASITPILCIGETAEQRSASQTFSILEAQLTPLLNVYEDSCAELIVAYEPVWAIGTGTIPSRSQLDEALAWIKEHIKKQRNKADNTTILYGGSIGDANAASCLESPFLDGLLIGNASLDFQKFKNIVSLNC